METDGLSYGISKDTLEKAVRVALQENSKSTMMFLLRERLTREIIASAFPIIVEPLVEVIKELEEEIASLKRNASTTYTESPKLKQLKEAVSDIVNIIDVEDI